LSDSKYFARKNSGYVLELPTRRYYFPPCTLTDDDDKSHSDEAQQGRIQQVKGMTPKLMTNL